MSKAVSDPAFWKERLNNATKEHYSVYVIHDDGWERILSIHLNIINRVIEKSNKVLDAGCGYGRFAPLFDRYTGVDISPGFIEKAKSKYPEKEFLVGDLKKLPFKDKAFDWVICCSVRQMIKSNLGGDTWDIMQKELNRISNKILILEYGEPERYFVL